MAKRTYVLEVDGDEADEAAVLRAVGATLAELGVGGVRAVIREADGPGAEDILRRLLDAVWSWDRETNGLGPLATGTTNPLLVVLHEASGFLEGRSFHLAVISATETGGAANPLSKKRGSQEARPAAQFWGVACPACGAAIGQPCDVLGSSTGVHFDRLPRPDKAIPAEDERARAMHAAYWTATREEGQQSRFGRVPWEDLDSRLRRPWIAAVRALEAVPQPEGQPGDAEGLAASEATCAPPTGSNTSEGG